MALKCNRGFVGVMECYRGFHSGIEVLHELIRDIELQGFARWC